MSYINKRAEAVKVVGLSATAACVIIAAGFIVADKWMWGIFFIGVAIVLANLTGRD